MCIRSRMVLVSIIFYQAHPLSRVVSAKTILPVSATTAITTNINNMTNTSNNRLSKFHQHWTAITTNTFVNNIIQHGYNLHFYTPLPTTPSPVVCSYYCSFLLSRTGSPYGSGYNQLTQQTDHQKSVLTAGTGYSKLLQLYVRHHQKEWRCSTCFQSETIEPILGRRSSSFQNRGNQGSSSDDQIKRLPSSHKSVRRFFTRSVTPRFKKFLLRLKWKNQVYQYCITAFGLASNLYYVLITKVRMHILEQLRSQEGIRISAYLLDDWLLIAETRLLVLTQMMRRLVMVNNLLQQLGWLINFKKSVLVPALQLKHLGFFILSTVMTTMTAYLLAQKI